jgi:hypothetical protein
MRGTIKAACYDGKYQDEKSAPEAYIARPIFIKAAR